MKILRKLCQSNYRMFKFWKALQYKKYRKLLQTDMNYDALLETLIIKLTFLGLEQQLFSKKIKFLRKETVHSIWNARSYLKKINKVYDEAYNIAQKKYIKKYGHLFVIENPNEIPNLDEIQQFVEGMPAIAEMRKKALDKALEILSKDMFDWWI